jgi:hypothetical protein
MVDASKILGAISALMGAYPNYKKQQRADDMEERKLQIQEFAATNKEPSSGISNIKFLESKYGAPLERSEAMGLLSPAGMAPAPYRAFEQDPDQYKKFVDLSKPERPKLDLGGGSPSPSGRPLIQAPQPNEPRNEQSTPAYTPEQRDEGITGASDAPNAGQPTKVRMKFNPATGTVDPISETPMKIKLEDL